MTDVYKLRLKFQGKNWKEYNFIINEFSLTEVLHKDLSPADSSCRLACLPDVELNNLLLGMGEYDIPAKVIKNGADFFTGYIKKNFVIPKTQRLQPVTLELVSGGYLLKQKLGRDVFIKTKQTVSSTVKEILDLAGAEYNEIPQINDVLYGVHLKTEDSYHAVLTAILYEYGYTFVFDKSGKISFVELFIHNPVAAHNITGKDCIEIINLEYSEKKKTEISVEWSGVEIVEGNCAFRETEGAQLGYPCYIELPPAAYYKGAADGVYIPYQHKDGEVIFAENVSVDIDGDMQSVKVQEFTPYNTKAFIKIKNTDNMFSRWIRKLDFKADKVYVKKSRNKSNAASNTTNNKRSNIKANYIYTKARAERLADDLLNYYKLSTINYKIKTAKDLPLGAIITISDKNIGTGLCRILEKKHDVLDNVREYVAESIGAYSPAEKIQAEIESEKKPPADGKDGDSAAYPVDYKDFTRFIFNDLKQSLINPPIQPTSPTNQVHDLSLSFTPNADKTISVTIKFKYTQGLYRASHFLLYQNTATTTPLAIDTATSSCRTIAVDQNAPDNHEYTVAVNLPQVSGNVQLHYRFALSAAFLGSGSLALHKDGIIDGGTDWHDVTVEQPPAGSLYNYWNYDTGELRAGKKDNYIRLNPETNELEHKGIEIKMPDLEQHIAEVENKIQEKIDKALIAILTNGYVQWPGMPSPEAAGLNLPGYRWVEVNYNGCFFRAKGTGANPFDGEEQGDAIRNITGYFSAGYGGFESFNNKGIGGVFRGAHGFETHETAVGTVDPNYDNVQRVLFDVAEYGNLPTAEENRPRNKTFIIWKLEKIGE